MRTGFATPVRRPWFHRAHGTRRSQASIAVAAIVALSAFTTACADNSPVSAPTSTLPAPQPSETASSPSVPEYTTDLDLTDEEKEAVEGALVAFDGYIETINEVFASGGENLGQAEKFARGGSLESLKTDAEEMRSNNQYMAGKYGFYDVQIESVTIPEDVDTPTKVSILFCNRDSEWSVVNKGDPLPSLEPKALTMQHIADNQDGTWKIANQYLRSKECKKG